MQPITPVPEISRGRLKQITHWVRDHLDILVAREGPNTLQPDDVLFLHELFVALCQSTTVTALDLRATGIHKAVKDIAGVATRWPGRLCDDCDKIIAVWTNKFGRLDDLHPFLCGRGGRLEGIASVTEYSRQALLKRWSEQCPENIHPNVSHRQGDLGFRAGDWWINSLFAHHAGIIGLESVEGGTTYDKKAAYALVLKDTGEMDATSDGFFTYRCPINDKGKFRLTAATPTARDPIRVLRCHSINSIWGPKAGIRYEGLYSVKGWSVRQARLKDTFCGEWKEGDILYEVTLHRREPVSMEEVTRRPTNMEMDDYVEYKRLRKLHREHKRKVPGQLLMLQQLSKAAPPILPLQASGSSITAPQSMLCSSPSVSRKATFKEPIFDACRSLQDTDRPPPADIISPMTVSDRQEFFFPPKKSFAPATPVLQDKDDSSPATSSNTIAHKSDAQVLSPGVGSLASSIRSGQSDLKEIIPWIDLEAGLLMHSLSNAPSVARERLPSQATHRLGAETAEMNPVKYVRRLARDAARADDSSLYSQEARKKSTEVNIPSLRLYSAKPILWRESAKEKEKKKKKKEKTGPRKTMFTQYPKFFDGAVNSAYQDDEYQSVPSLFYAPTSFPPSKQDYLLATHHDHTFSHGIEDIEFASPLDRPFSRDTTPTQIGGPMALSKVSHGRLVVGLRWVVGKFV